MTPLELSQEAQGVIAKVKKLLAMAETSSYNEHEAAAAAAKAQELLVAYNLDMASIGGSSERGQTELKGGLYKWQRYLWEAVARLNFCMYWSIQGNEKGAKYMHRVLGRQENTIGARVMSEYLQQTIERLAKTIAREREINVFCREMIAYREGMSTRLIERLNSLRWERLQEERRRQQEAEATRDHTASSGTDVVLSSFIKDEHLLNPDHLSGYEPGTTARRRAEADARYNDQLAKHKQWRMDNPEAAARQDKAKEAEREADRKREERNAKRRTGGYRERAYTAEDQRRDMAEFGEGYVEGGNVSLNQQVDEGTPSHRIGS